MGCTSFSRSCLFLAAISPRGQDARLPPAVRPVKRSEPGWRGFAWNSPKVTGSNPVGCTSFSRSCLFLAAISPRGQDARLPPAVRPVKRSEPGWRGFAWNSPKVTGSNPVGCISFSRSCLFLAAISPRGDITCPGNPGRKPVDRCTAGSGCFGFGLSH